MEIPLSEYRKLQKDGGWKGKLTILLLSVRGLDFEREYKFYVKRLWRFDYAIPKYKVAIEYEGLFKPKTGKSGHTATGGYLKDIEKYNAATVAGWRVLRYTAKNYQNVLDDLRVIMEEAGDTWHP